ncbi:MAG: hypothetical protein KF757_00390 [Phycisphaeraceae bacterium]|nr:hypothetical protein [Phycisphaeraceae bacterium]MCW5761665.1 hypothetical protein [Phycisphaeraceae bacterium]
MSIKAFISRFATVAAAALLLVATHLSFASDVVHLKDGRKIEGTIVRELDGSVWIKTRLGSIENTEFFLADNIAKIERDAPAATATDPKPNPIQQIRPRTPGAPRGAIISLEGTVGIEMTAKTLYDLIPILERDLGSDGTGIVVFKINSGGGLLLEIQRLSDVIHNEYKKRFRTVAWIESAISAAAMTAHCAEEIYFLPEGNYGACTGWSGRLQAVAGRGLEEVLYMMERISARGGYDPKIMRAMQINEPLSCTIDPRTGQVYWYQTQEGEHLVNPGNDILTFTAQQAERYRFSKGTAKNLAELTQKLGYQEVDWVGENRVGYIYPISRAESAMLDFRKKVSDDQARTNEYFATYMEARAAAAQAPRDIRPRFVGRARQNLNRIESMVRNNPNFALLTWGMELSDWERDWLAAEKEYLTNLLRD